MNAVRSSMTTVSDSSSTMTDDQHSDTEHQLFMEPGRSNLRCRAEITHDYTMHHHPLAAYISDEKYPTPGSTCKSEVSSECVPLAELDEFSESNGLSSDDGRLLCSPNEDGGFYTPCNEDGNLDTDGTSAETSSFIKDGGKVTRKKRRQKHKGRSNNSARAISDEPLSSGDHVIDMNGDVSSKYKEWFSHIENYHDRESLHVPTLLHHSHTCTAGDHPLMEFAEKNYNSHYLVSGYSSALTKTVNMVRRKSSETVPLEDMLKYTKNSTIPTSHVHLLENEDILQACSIFKDLSRYVKGTEFKTETSVTLIHSVLARGQERVALRDEIYCQLVRFTNGNPSVENTIRAWTAMCLCAVAFRPSHTLMKHLVTYLKHCCDESDGESSAKILPYAQYCLQHLTNQFDRPRKCVPSLAEIEAVSNLQPLVFRIYFLDGTTKAIACSPSCTADEALHIIQEKIGLKDIHGWALYESMPSEERYVRNTEYLSDILSIWEDKQHESHHGTALVHIPPQGKLIMCKRLYRRITDIPDDPVELHLLYSQAVHFVVHLDEYMVPVHTATHLAGLQAQVEYDDFDEDKMCRYVEEEVYINQRVLCFETRDWPREIAHAHQKYGKGKTATEAEFKYLTIVSQCQLYGCTKIFAHYAGIWPYGTECVLAINYDGIKCFSIQHKTLVFDHYYADIQEIILQERQEDYSVTLMLKNCVSQNRQKCYMFECYELDDFASLVEFYSPIHATWTQLAEPWKKNQIQIASDWLKLHEDIMVCRRLLTQSGTINKPTSGSGGLLKMALTKFSSRNCVIGRHDDDQVDVALSSVWAFSRSPLKSALSKCKSHETDDVSARMFNSTLVYTGLESTAALEDVDLVIVVQTLLTKCMENEMLCDEFYLQLIKQTTDTQGETNHKAVVRYWHLMTMAACVMLPSNQLIFNYLHLRLRRAALQRNTEEGKYAFFCIKSLYRTYENMGRKYPPSNRELHFVTQRKSIEARVYVPDGHGMLIEFDSATTVKELLPVMKAKTGMRLDAEGYAIYQVMGEREIYLQDTHKLADALFSWERFVNKLDSSSGTKDMILLFKKRLFIEPFMNLNDPVEVDVLYNQSVTEVFEQKIPLTKTDATALCALRAQYEFGDFGQTNCYDYSVVMRILPRHMRELLVIEDVALLHQSFAGTNHVQSNIAFLDILKHWPLYGATMFEVSTSMDTLPKNLWFTVSQMGVHLREVKGPNIYYSCTYEDIASCVPTSKLLTIVTGQDLHEQEYVFLTNEADQITLMIKDYGEELMRREHTSSPIETPMADIDEAISISIDSVTYDTSS